MSSVKARIAAAWTALLSRGREVLCSSNGRQAAEARAFDVIMFLQCLGMTLCMGHFYVKQEHFVEQMQRMGQHATALLPTAVVLYKYMRVHRTRVVFYEVDYDFMVLTVPKCSVAARAVLHKLQREREAAWECAVNSGRRRQQRQLLPPGFAALLLRQCRLAAVGPAECKQLFCLATHLLCNNSGKSSSSSSTEPEYTLYLQLKRRCAQSAATADAAWAAIGSKLRCSELKAPLDSSFAKQAPYSAARLQALNSLYELMLDPLGKPAMDALRAAAQQQQAATLARVHYSLQQSAAVVVPRVYSHVALHGQCSASRAVLTARSSSRAAVAGTGALATAVARSSSSNSNSRRAGAVSIYTNTEVILSYRLQTKC
jgi:hypothetical protein